MYTPIFHVSFITLKKRLLCSKFLFSNFIESWDIKLYKFTKIIYVWVITYCLMIIQMKMFQMYIDILFSKFASSSRNLIIDRNHKYFMQ